MRGRTKKSDHITFREVKIKVLAHLRPWVGPSTRTADWAKRFHGLLHHTQQRGAQRIVLRPLLRTPAQLPSAAGHRDRLTHLSVLPHSLVLSPPSNPPLPFLPRPAPCEGLASIPHPFTTTHGLTGDRSSASTSGATVLHARLSDLSATSFFAPSRHLIAAKCDRDIESA
jgi:hypothetical protein